MTGNRLTLADVEHLIDQLAAAQRERIAAGTADLIVMVSAGGIHGLFDGRRVEDLIATLAYARAHPGAGAPGAAFLIALSGGRFDVTVIRPPGDSRPGSDADPPLMRA